MTGPGPIKNGEISGTKDNNSRKQGAIQTIIEVDEDIIVLNNVTKFHKILINTIQLKRADIVLNYKLTLTKDHNS